MWRHFVAFFLLASFLIQTFSTSLLVVNFYANQKYVAANFCVNKYKPQMKCSGKCQLTKKLKQEENKDKQNPGRKLENKDQVISSMVFFSTIEISSTIIKRFYHSSQQNFSSLYLYTFFHPPRIV